MNQTDCPGSLDLLYHRSKPSTCLSFPAAKGVLSSFRGQYLLEPYDEKFALGFQQMFICVFLLNLIDLHEVLLWLAVKSQVKCVCERPNLFSALFYTVTSTEITNC